jgi:hypothetical protein
VWADGWAVWSAVGSTLGGLAGVQVILFVGITVTALNTCGVIRTGWEMGVYSSKSLGAGLEELDFSNRRELGLPIAKRIWPVLEQLELVQLILRRAETLPLPSSLCDAHCRWCG